MASKRSPYLNLPLPQDSDIIDVRDISDGFTIIDQQFQMGIPIPELRDDGYFYINNINTNRKWRPELGIDYYTAEEQQAIANAIAQANASAATALAAESSANSSAQLASAAATSAQEAAGTITQAVTDAQESAAAAYAAAESATSPATPTTTGLMPAADKDKLDKIDPEADKTVIQNNLTTATPGSALDAVQGKELNDRLTPVETKLAGIESGANATEIANALGASTTAAASQALLTSVKEGIDANMSLYLSAAEYTWDGTRSITSIYVPLPAGCTTDGAIYQFNPGSNNICLFYAFAEPRNVKFALNLGTRDGTNVPAGVKSKVEAWFRKL